MKVFGWGKAAARLWTFRFSVFRGAGASEPEGGQITTVRMQLLLSVGVNSVCAVPESPANRSLDE